MRGKSSIIPTVILFAALLACKKGGDAEGTAASSETPKPAAPTASAAPKASAQPAAASDAAPGQLPEFAGCDLAASAKAFEGAWYTYNGPFGWELTAGKLTWYDGTEQPGTLAVTSPCSVSAGPNGQVSLTFAQQDGKLILGAPAVGVPCGDRVVGCTGDSVQVLAGTACTTLTGSTEGVKAGSPADVLHWTREKAECSLDKSGTPEKLVLAEKGGATRNAPKAGQIYLEGGSEAHKVASFAVAKVVVDALIEENKAEETGPTRVAITAKLEKICDEHRIGGVCNDAAWYRCTNLKQCNQAVTRARLAVELDPNDGRGSLDTLATVLCQTGKADEANTYYDKSCKAGYSTNCGKLCTAEVAKATPVAKQPVTTQPIPSASAGWVTPKGPSRPKRPGRAAD